MTLSQATTPNGVPLLSSSDGLARDNPRDGDCENRSARKRAGLNGQGLRSGPREPYQRGRGNPKCEHFTGEMRLADRCD